MSKNIRSFLYIIGLSFLMAAIFYLPDVYRYIQDGVLYIGKGDGLKQMIPFQLYLYEHFKHFEMFYDVSYGLGGDFFTGLSYYYATSPFAYINFFMLSVYDHLSHATLVRQLVHMQYIIAGVKCALIFCAMYYAARMMNVRHLYAVVAAVLFSWSTIFYYFTYTWSFFSDVMFYLPLSILGVELVLKKKRMTILTIGIALTLFSNFYLAYYEVLIVGTYILLRIIRPYKHDVMTRWQSIGWITVSVVLGSMIGSIGFVRGVLAFLGNDRSHITLNIPLFTELDGTNNLFYGGFHLTICFIAMIALFAFPLYRHYYYKIFAVVTWVMLLGSLTPYFDSMFNGFSMPQRRWVYALAFSTAILASLFLQHMSELHVRALLLSSIPIILILIVSFILQGPRLWVAFVPLIITLMVLRIHYRKNVVGLLVVVIICCQGVLIRDYHYTSQRKYFPEKDWLYSTNYYHPTIAKELNILKKQQTDDLRRIELAYPVTPNTPMYYGINSTKLYASLFDANIFDFYEKELKIAMHRNSNSYYAGLSRRNNLQSLFNVDDYVTPYDNQPLLFNVIKTFKAGYQTFTIGRNPYPLPSVRVVHKTYDPDQLTTPIDKEHAMLQGVIKDGGTSTVKQATDLLPSATWSVEDALQSGDTLNVTRNGGGITLHLKPEEIKMYKELYVTIKSDIVTPADQDYYTAVNEFKQHRHAKNYRYRRVTRPTVMNIKVSPDIHIGFPKGVYHLNVYSIYGEDYSTLKSAYHQYKNQHLKFKEAGHHYAVDLTGKEQGTLVLPIPYTAGMKAEIDGQPAKVEEVNYLMTGISVKKGDHHVKLSYTPPYFKATCIASVIGCVLLMLIHFKRKKEKNINKI